ncbi:MAG: MurR/RpiR family transcriptional regulator [bacterium]
MQRNIRELKERMKYKIPHLTESQKIVANYIVENPQKFALSSIRELEKELKTSKSTIVRLAQTLGYDGFYELKSAFVDILRHELDPINRYKTFLSEPAGELNYLKVIADETVNNIHETLLLVDNEQYNNAVNLIENADHVYTIGLGMSTYLAEIASYLFNRVSVNSNFMTYKGLTFAEQIINLPKEDVIFAFSFPPYSEETIQAACYAQEKGLKVIAVTDKVTSKIVQYSDVVLQVVVESVTISNSIMSVLVLLYSLIAQIGHDLKNKTLETIEAIEHVRKEHSGKII